jgi:outer membrane immunogenic protein
MKKFLLGATALASLAMVMPAAAADLAARPYTKAPMAPVAAIYDWTGFYIGANGGGAWSRKCFDVVPVVAGALLPEGCADATGAVAGGQVGYRWQASSWVFGLEAQGDWADLSGSRNSTQFIRVPGDATFNARVRALGLFTGQVGYAWNNALLYVKGGAAVADDRYEHRFLATGVVFDRGTESRWGAVVGAGIEYGFAPNWSVGIEYDHLFMGDRNVNFTTPAGGVLATIDRVRQDVDMVTARVNFRFGGGAPVVARY